MSKYLRLEIYKYLDLGDLIRLISKLSRQERELLEETSHISQTQRTLKIEKPIGPQSTSHLISLFFPIKLCTELTLHVDDLSNLKSLIILLENLPVSFQNEHKLNLIAKVDHKEIFKLLSRVDDLKIKLKIVSCTCNQTGKRSFKAVPLSTALEVHIFDFCVDLSQIIEGTLGPQISTLFFQNCTVKNDITFRHLAEGASVALP